MKFESEFLILLLIVLSFTSFVILDVSKLTEIGGADSAGYLVMARGLLEGEGFVSHTVKQYDWVQTSIVTPGDYVDQPGSSVGVAMFFALFGESPLTGKLFNLLSAFLVIPLLVYCLSRTWSLSPRVSLAAACIALFYPANYFAHLYANSDDPFVMLSLAALVCFFHARGKIGWYVFSGVFLGLAFITKFSAALVWITLGIYGVWALWRKFEPGLSLRNLTLLFVVAIFVTAPLLGRNIAYFGDPLFTVNAAQSWTFNYHQPGTSFKMFFWDDGPPSFSWALKEYSFDDFSRKYMRSFTRFLKEDGIFFALMLAGLLLLRARKEAKFVLIATASFILFFIGYHHFEGRYFLLLHSIWSIMIAYLFFNEKASRLFRLAGIAAIVVFFLFIGYKFFFVEMTPYQDTSFTIGRYEFNDAVVALVPPGEPVMSYWPRQTDFLSRHPVLMQLDEDTGTLLRILAYYNASYIECGKKNPSLDVDERFTKIFDGEYDLCKVNWEIVNRISPPVPALVNITQDWSYSMFRPHVEKIN